MVQCVQFGEVVLVLAWCSYPVWKSRCCWMDKHPMSLPLNLLAVKASGR